MTTRLQEIEGRLRAATPGRWVAVAPGDGPGMEKWMVSREVGVGDVPPQKFYIATIQSVGNVVQDASDAVFIALAPLDLAYLLALAKAGESELEVALKRLILHASEFQKGAQNFDDTDTTDHNLTVALYLAKEALVTYDRVAQEGTP